METTKTKLSYCPNRKETTKTKLSFSHNRKKTTKTKFSYSHNREVGTISVRAWGKINNNKFRKILKLEIFLLSKSNLQQCN